MPSNKQIVVASEAFWIATKDGRGHLVTEGEHFTSDDPVVKARPTFFVTVEEAAERLAPVTFGAVEAASAAPGEKR